MIKLLPYIIIIIFSFLFIDIVPSGPDAKLYFGLAKNLFNGVGYIDTIRHDEILPPIGYPYIISLALGFGIGAYTFMISMLIVSFMLLYKSFKNLNIDATLAIVLILIFINILTPFNAWGIEVALVFSISILLHATTIIIKHQNIYTLLFFAFTLLINVLVRPILMPFVYLMIPIIIYFLVKKNVLRKEVLGVTLIFFTAIYLIGSYSNHLHGDKRFLSGTYSEIPLYCAWNRHITLTTNYYSSNWKYLPPYIKKIAVEPLQNISGWQDRADRLKEEVIDFVIDEPYRAFEGYFWRLSKFTINADSKMYEFLFYSWLILLSLMLYNYTKLEGKFKLLFILSSIVTMYVIAVTSVFVYVNNRYYVSPSLFILFSIASLIFIARNNKNPNKIKEKSILFLSANDFKEKSIQVIRKTPQAYIENGWNVNYIVARDNSKSGNYFYEKEINPKGARITRFYMPFGDIKDKVNNHVIKTIVSKIYGYISILTFLSFWATCFYF